MTSKIQASKDYRNHALVSGIKASGDHATQDQPPVSLPRREQGTTCVFLWQNILNFIGHNMDWIPLKEHLMFLPTSAIWQLQGILGFFPFWGVHEMFRIDTILTFRPGRGPQPFSVARSFPPRALRLNRSQPWRHMWSEWGLHWAKYAKMLSNSVEICFMLEASSKTEIIVLNIMLFTFCGSFIAAVLCRHYCWTGHCKWLPPGSLNMYVVPFSRNLQIDRKPWQWKNRS